MTREEAIAFFKDMNECTYGNLEAVEMAIKALSQEPTIQEKQAESEKYQKAFDDGYANGYEQARFDYEKQPCDFEVEQDLCKNCLFGEGTIYCREHCPYEAKTEQEPCDKCVYSTKDGYCQYDDISETIPPLEPCDKKKDCSTCKYEEYSSNYQPCRDCGTLLESYTKWEQKDSVMESEQIAQERYKDLCEYFGDAKDILKSREDFKAWLERVKWHIRKAEELYRKYEYKKEPCDDCIFEEGSKYCIEHCPHEARVESYEDKQMNNISKNIARMFADFVNSFKYDAYEIAMVCSQVLSENNVKFSCAKHPIGIDIFTDTEMENKE